MELKEKLQSFNDQFWGQRQELKQLHSKIRQAGSDQQLAVNKAKLLEEELTSQHKCKKQNEDKSYRTVLIRYSYNTLLQTPKETEKASCCPLCFH